MFYILIYFSIKVNPEGKYVVDVDKDINIADCTPNTRVSLRNDSYTLHKILPTKVIYIYKLHLLIKLHIILCRSIH